MGFLDDADLTAQDAPNDPFGFGREFWPVRVKECGEPKVTNNGDRFGMMVTWECIHPEMSQQLGYGNWLQLPVPKAHQEAGVPWDPKSQEGKKVIFGLVQLFEALGFDKSEMAKVDGDAMVGRTCLAKISAKQNDEGFWQFNLFAYKPLPEGSAEGMGEFTPEGQSNLSEEEMLKRELGG